MEHSCMAAWQQEDARRFDAYFLAENIVETQLNLMRGIKAVFDPKGILNPGKVI